MFNIQTIENVSDCSPLYLPHSLYLKPLAKMHISVGLPINKTGKSISNLEIMDKLSAELKPDKFLLLKVSKSTINCIRFEAELDEHKRIRSAIARLDGVSLRISGFNESFRVRCSEAKDEFPTRHDWDSYFRDARNMDEMKAGERPDTIHLTHIPIRWFCPRHAENDDNPKPSESIFKRIFEKYGRVRAVDIPICDPYRQNMNADISGMKTFSYEQDVLFEGYVQFEEYAGFVRAMDEFRGMKLVRKFIDKTQAVNIYVTFDKTKHLSEAQIIRRERVRKRLQAKAQAEEDERERAKKEEQLRLDRERQKEEQLKLAELDKQRQREEKRKEKHLKKIQERGQVEISQKIRVEERKLQIAQRKLESIRILEQLFNRINLKQTSRHSRRHHNLNDVQNQHRERLVEKYKSATEKLLGDQRKIVEDIKSKTPLLGLLKMKTKKHQANSSDEDDDDDDDNKKKNNQQHYDKQKQQQQQQQVGINGGAAVNMVNNPLNPFKAVAAMAAAAVPHSTAPGTAAPAGTYSAEAASEWMKSLSMFPYGVPSVFPGVATLYRPPPPFPVSSNYRGFAPRPRGLRGGRGRGRGRGSTYEGGHSSYYSKHYGDERYEEENGSYYKSSRGRHRSRSSSYSRSRSRSRGRSRRRSHSRSRSRSHYHKSSYSSRSRNRSHSHSRSRSSKSTSQRTNKKLVSTRRSRNSSESSRSRTRSRSRSYVRSKRSWSRRGSNRRSDRHYSRSRSSRSRSASTHRVVLETDELVRSAEQIKTTIENKTKERMREEEREIKKNFRTPKYVKEQPITTTTNKLYDDNAELNTSNEVDKVEQNTSEEREPLKSKSRKARSVEDEEEEEEDEKGSYRRRSSSIREEVAA